MTEVVNIYHLPTEWTKDPQYVYVGRAGRGHSGRFGNPIRLYRKCQVCGLTHVFVGETIPCFEVYLRRRLQADEAFHADFLALYGKKLACFCSPRLCHANVIRRVLCELLST